MRKGFQKANRVGTGSFRQSARKKCRTQAPALFRRRDSDELTEAEASFRALKSELSIRPLFHQKESRVKAHVLVAFLGMPCG